MIDETTKILALDDFSELDFSTIPLIANRYQLHEVLGKGGMGIVFRATDRLSGQMVALKQVTTQSSDLEFTSRIDTEHEENFRLALIREFQILASLHHPYIISVLDFGFDDENRPFFTMQYLENSRLMLDCLGDSLELRLKYIQQLLQALAYLHRRGILHRDLKSGNVLIQNETVRVLDFGLSIERERVNTLQVGTLSYMAPELLSRQPASIASDLYAVGILAYQLLSGRYPFTYKNVPELFKAIRQGVDNFEVLPVSAEVRAAIQNLLAKDPQDRYASAEEAIRAFSAAQGIPVPLETREIRDSFLTAAQLVGREEELRRLSLALRGCARGKGSFWLVGGESGVGKSRLLEEIRVQALTQNIRVIRGQDVKEGGGLYHLWRNPVRRLVLTSDVSDADAETLRELVPDIQSLLGREINIDLDTTEIPISPKERLILAISTLFRQQKHPMLLLLEDLQWSMESLVVLKVLMPILSDLPIMVVGSYRDDERPTLPDTLPAATLLHLDRLTPSEMEQLAVSMLGESGRNPRLLTWLVKETEGNVFFVIETLRALAEEAGRLGDIIQMNLPTSIVAKGVEAIIQRRIERVPDWAYTLLTFAALMGRQLDLKVIATLSEEVKIEAWLAACANAAVLVTEEGHWQFAHDKLRDQLLANLAPHAQQILHRMVAQAIETTYPDDTSHAYALMTHWHMAGDETKELGYLRVAIQQAMAVSGYQEVTRLGKRALELIPADNEDAMVMLRYIGDAYCHLSDYPTAQTYLRQSLQVAQNLNNTSGVIEAFLLMAALRNEQGEYHVAKAHAVQALSFARKLDEKPLIITALNQLGRTAWYLGDYEAAEHYYEECLALARSTNNPMGIANSLTSLAMVAGEFGDYHTARNYLEETLTLQQRIGDQRGIATTLTSLGLMSGRLADYTSAQNYLEQAMAIERRIGSQAGLARALEYLADILERQGQNATAKAYFIESVEVRRKIGERPGIAYSLIGLAFNHLVLGNTDKARTDLKEAFGLARDMGALPTLIEVMVGFAWLKVLEGHPLAAAELLGCLVIHPAMTQNVILARVTRLQAKLREKLPMEDLKTALERGKSLNFETEVAKYKR